MAKRRLKARYQTMEPKKVKVLVNKCHMDEDKNLIQEQVYEEKIMYVVRLPQGHSIRIDRKELERLGFHLKPKLIDMDTGDVVDLGGDPYDFGPEEDIDYETVIEEEDDEFVQTPRKTKAATA